MTDEQYSELLSYVMLLALNTTQLLYRQSRRTPLSSAEVSKCQDYLLDNARRIQERLLRREPWPYVPPVGRADA